MVSFLPIGEKCLGAEGHSLNCKSIRTLQACAIVVFHVAPAVFMLRECMSWAMRCGQLPLALVLQVSSSSVGVLHLKDYSSGSNFLIHSFLFSDVLVVCNGL